MTVMMALAAGPAFSKINCEFEVARTCSGGGSNGGSGGGGFGQHTIVDPYPGGNLVLYSGGEGSRDGLRFGQHEKAGSEPVGRGFQGGP